LNILNPELKEFGIGIIKTKSEKLRGLCSEYVNLLVIDYGAHQSPVIENSDEL
jgi:hypothetical protein